MKLRDVLLALGGEVITSAFDPDVDVRVACGADLMSDVLAFAHQDATLVLTGLTNPQVVKTAEVASVAAVVFVRGKVPPRETVELAEQKGIPLIRTNCSMFEACGRLYSLGMESCDVRGPEREAISKSLAELRTGLSS